jgi:hypothetical protein
MKIKQFSICKYYIKLGKKIAKKTETDTGVQKIV